MALKVGELYHVLKLDDRGFNASLKTAGESAKSMSTLMKVGVAGAVAVAGVAIAKMARTGMQDIKDLDNAMKKYQVTTGATAEEAKKASDVIENLHRNNTDSMEQLGDAVTRMRQRFGELGDDLGKHTQDFLNFSKVTGQDTPKAIDDMSSILKGFNLDVSASARIMDQLMAVSQKTGASIPNLQSALAQASPAMKALNIPIEQGIALLGQLESRGVDAGSAVQGLRRALEAIANPTKQQAEAMSILGMKAKQASDGTLDWSDSFPQLIRRLQEGNLSAQEASSAIMLLGRSGLEMVRGMEGGAQGIENLMEVIRNSEGTVTRASETYDKQLGERWELIQRKYLRPFMRTLGEVLITVLEKVLTFIETWGPKIVSVFETIWKALKYFYDSVVNLINMYLEFCAKLERALEPLIRKFWEFFDASESVTGSVSKTYSILGDRGITASIREQTGAINEQARALANLGGNYDETSWRTPKSAGQITPPAPPGVPTPTAPTASTTTSGITPGEREATAWEKALKAVTELQSRYKVYISEMPSFSEMLGLDDMRDKIRYGFATVEEYIPLLQKWQSQLVPLSQDWKLVTDALMEFERVADQAKTKTEELAQTFEERMMSAVQGWASGFSAQLNDVLWNANATFDNILESFAKMITQMIIQLTIVEPLMRMFGSMFGFGLFAKGGVFNHGGVTAFAGGGVVTGPTVFPMARGMGIMGEAGPEAIMPLKRDPSGKLGVDASGIATPQPVIINLLDRNDLEQVTYDAMAKYPGANIVVNHVLRGQSEKTSFAFRGTRR